MNDLIVGTKVLFKIEMSEETSGIIVDSETIVENDERYYKIENIENLDTVKVHLNDDGHLYIRSVEITKILKG